MRRLNLVNPIRTRRGPLATFVADEKKGQDWRREPNGDYVLTVEGEADEFVIPSTGVQYEQRARAGKK